MAYKDPDYMRKYHRRYYIANREKSLAQSKAWRQNNLEKDNQNKRNRERKAREEALVALGGKCVRCGFNDPRALQFDHINGDGYLEEHYKNHSTKQYYRLVAKNPDNMYQILCANCNWIKRFENNEHGQRIKGEPSQRPRKRRGKVVTNAILAKIERSRSPQ